MCSYGVGPRVPSRDWLQEAGRLEAGVVAAAVRRDMGQAAKVTGHGEVLGAMPTVGVKSEV